MNASHSAKLASDLLVSGKSIDDVLKTVQAVRTATEAELKALLDSEPFIPGQDSVFEEIKRLARMEWQLKGINTELKGMFDSVTLMQGPNTPQLASPAPMVAAPLALPSRTGGRISNAHKVAAFIADKLAEQSPQSITIAELATATGVPRGSMTYAIKACVHQGLFREARGVFSLPD